MGRGRKKHRAPRRLRAGLSLRLSDVVLSVSSAVAVAYLLIAARWVPGALEAALGFAFIGVGPPMFRALARRFPKGGWFDLAASFWLLPAAIIGHRSMGPIADSVRADLLDRYLAHADLKIFGAHPAVWLETRLPDWATEFLLISYYTYYLWPVLVGAFLYLRRPRHVYDQYQLALTLFFAANFVFYAWVPAVGPRFFLSHEFQAPLTGLWVTPLLDSAMRGPIFLRDCFPSGHTGLTLVVLAFAFWHARRLFWWILPGCLSLIAATVMGRFHYVVDLLCAVPMAILVIHSAIAWSRAEPRGVQVVPSPELAFLRRVATGLVTRPSSRRREPVRA